ncbi:hypothetical protein [Pseudomonas sp. D(2018)]|uniref:hypothetical protein n=1 Tax=Pseudomonas sp. D(2018) TaxID=2502238 RepID=UPI0010F66EEB|nr:hypothetical protein [Pseudomonas sp. D(2018)]
MAIVDEMASSLRRCLVATGDVERHKTDVPSCRTEHHGQTLRIAVLTATDAQARAWARLLMPLIQRPVGSRWPEVSIALHVQSWCLPLLGTFDEIHVADASGLPTELLAELSTQTELFSLHYLAPPTVNPGFNWSSEAALAAYLAHLLLVLSGSSFFGLSWRDYLAHRNQLGHRRGTYIQAGSWDELRQSIRGLISSGSQVLSALLFLEGYSLTIGNYVDVCQLLEDVLPMDCRVSVCTLAGEEERYGFTLLVTSQA